MEKINIKKTFNINKYLKEKKSIVVLLIFILIITIIWHTIINSIMPTFSSLAKNKSINMSTRIINQVVLEKMSNVSYSDIVTFEKNDQGQITIIKLNSVQMNKLASEISLGIQDEFLNLDDKTINITLGSTFGNDLFVGLRTKNEYKNTSYRRSL